VLIHLVVQVQVQEKVIRVQPQFQVYVPPVPAIVAVDTMGVMLLIMEPTVAAAEVQGGMVVPRVQLGLRVTMAVAEGDPATVTLAN
jgi:hypothetical protein